MLVDILIFMSTPFFVALRGLCGLATATIPPAMLTGINSLLGYLPYAFAVFPFAKPIALGIVYMLSVLLIVFTIKIAERILSFVPGFNRPHILK